LTGSRKKRKQFIQETLLDLEEMEESNPLSTEQLRDRMILTNELFHIMEEEELIWLRRSHETWLLKGENNTEYFHRIANGKKRKQSIFYLHSENGIISGTGQLLQHATSYYKSLFGPADGNAFDLDPDVWPIEERVTEQENVELTKPFLEDEIRNALFQMERNKVTGPDGLPIEFFQKCWELMKGDICDLFHDFYMGVLDIKRINYVIITLLPKVKDVSRIQQYRPICLLNCLYK
jgi:hypothetical protein